MTRRLLIAFAVLLGSCLPAATEPPYRQIVAAKLDTLFAPSAKMRGVSLSGAQRVNTLSGPQWRVCLRGISTGLGGASAVHIYALFINDRNEITDRRLAEPADNCARERYQPLARTSR